MPTPETAPAPAVVTPEINPVEPANQPEVQVTPETARETKEQRERKREKIKQAIIESARLVKEFTDEEEARQAFDAVTLSRMRWSAIAAETAMQQIDPQRNEYLVTVLDENNNPRKDSAGNVIQRWEGVPVDGLMDAVASIQELRKRHKEEVDGHNHKVDSANWQDSQATLHGKTPEQLLGDLRENEDKDFKQELQALVDQWEAFDRDNPDGQYHDKIVDGANYDPDFRKQQMERALLKLIEEYKDKDPRTVDYDIANVQHLVELQSLLSGSAKNYFQYHFGKENGENLSPEESTQQDPYTIHEAKLIETDDEFRNYLLERYKAEIPNFDELDAEKQNYELAKLALRDRKLADLREQEPQPKEKIILVNIEEIAKRMAWSKAEEQLREHFQKSSWFRRAIKGLTENYHRLKFYQQALEEIKNNNDLMEAISGRLIASGRASDTPADRGNYYKILDAVIGEYEDGLIEDNSKEKGDTFQAGSEVALKAAEMFKAHATGDWSKLGPEYTAITDPRARVELYVKNVITPLIGEDKQWGEQEEASGLGARLKNKFGFEKKQKGKDSLLYASNFFAMAEKRKADIEQIVAGQAPESPELQAQLREHFAGLENLDIQLGLKERDLYNNKPKGVLNFYEKWMDIAETNKFMGRFVSNPITVGVAAALMTRGGQMAAKALGVAALGAAGFMMSPVIMPLIVGAGVGGLYRAMQHNKNLKYDIAHEQRNLILGGDASQLLKDSGAGLTTMSYEEAISKLEQAQAKDPSVWTEEEKTDVARIIAMRQTEKQKGNQHDLFYVSEEVGGQTGTVLTERRRLNNLLKEVGTPASIQEIIEVEQEAVRDDITEKDNNQKWFRMLSSAKKGLAGAIWGGVAGLGIQQGLYVLGRLVPIDAIHNFFASRGTNLEHIMDNMPKSALAGWWRDTSMWRSPSGGASSLQSVVEHSASGQSAPTIESSHSGQAELPWKSMGKLNHEDWHDEVGRHGVRNLLFEGKQQQGDLLLDKNSNQVSASMDRMIHSLDKDMRSGGGVNWDKSVDSKLSHILQEMKGHQQSGNLVDHMKVRVFPENGSEGYVAGHLDGNNKLVFSDTERNAFFDGNGKQMAKFIEYGYEDDKGNFHTFATSVGKGVKVPDLGPEPLPPGPGSGLGSGSGSSMGSEAAQGLIGRDYDMTVPLVPPTRVVYKRGEKYKPGEEGREEESDYNASTDGAEANPTTASEPAGGGGENNPEATAAVVPPAVAEVVPAVAPIEAGNKREAVDRKGSTIDKAFIASETESTDEADRLKRLELYDKAIKQLNKVGRKRDAKKIIEAFNLEYRKDPARATDEWKDYFRISEYKKELEKGKQEGKLGVMLNNFEVAPPANEKERMKRVKDLDAALRNDPPLSLMNRLRDAFMKETMSPKDPDGIYWTPTSFKYDRYAKEIADYEADRQAEAKAVEELERIYTLPVSEVIELMGDYPKEKQAPFAKKLMDVYHGLSKAEKNRFDEIPIRVNDSKRAGKMVVVTPKYVNIAFDANKKQITDGLKKFLKQP